MIVVQRLMLAFTRIRHLSAVASTRLSLDTMVKMMGFGQLYRRRAGNLIDRDKRSNC